MREPPPLLFDRALLEERDYWHARLAAFVPPSSIRSATAGGARGDGCGRVGLTIDGDARARLERLTGGSPFLAYCTLVAAWLVQIARYTGASRVCVGSPARRSEDAPPVRNAVAVVEEVDPSASFRSLLASLRRTLLDAYARQRYPIDWLARDLAERHGHAARPFETLVSLEAIHDDPPPLDLELQIRWRLRPERIEADFLFDAARLGEGAVRRLARHQRNLLGSLLADPAAPSARAEMADDEEREWLVRGCNVTDRPELLSDTSLATVFAAHAARRPDATALVLGSARMSYGDLDRRANRLALLLMERGLGRDAPVPLVFERSMEMVVAVLAVAKAGGAFFPLDPHAPAKRLWTAIRSVGARACLTAGSASERVPSVVPRIRIDSEALEAAGSDRPPAVAVHPDQIAYAIHTSGSTGGPKAVLVTHRGFTALTRATIEELGITPASRVLNFATYTFDASLWQMFMALHAGATLFLVPEEHVHSVRDVARLVREHSIEVADLPPALLALLDPSDVPSLRTVTTGGERCAAETRARWASRRFYNVYGPTEATVASTWQIVDASTAPDVSLIGRPLPNVRAYVLDDELRPTPTGVPGQLFLGGVGVGQGYLARPDVTAVRFPPDAFGGAPGGRLFATGDIARRRDDGTLELLGRNDDQVKVRGFRIELGEIQSALTEHPGVHEAVIVARDDRLIAYFVPSRDGGSPAAGALRAHLESRLPRYMVPSFFVPLERMPRLPNLKVDRAALPPPAPEPRGDLVLPRTAEERAIARIWSSLLGVDPVDVRDSFFHLGGHSLLATQAASRISEEFGVSLPLLTFFRTPTVADLAGAVLSLKLSAVDPAEAERLLTSIERLSEAEATRLGEASGPAGPLSEDPTSGPGRVH